MARIPDSFIQDLLNRVDIVDVVERYLPLKKGGQNYMACCPFHKEKSPSFTVSPNKQFYHCFGCGAHGSAVSFVMEYEGLTFPEAVAKLAESIGLQVPQEAGGGPETPRAEPGVFDALKAACDYYRQALKSAPSAINYLKGRGLDGKTAARFGLGYAPGGDDWQALKKVFPDYDWNKLLAEAGLVIDKEDTKRRYDRFRDRVMFPILNQRGAVIGFGGRVMGQGEPKYLNSPETPVFEKGRELYGLTQARAAIREVGRVLVVEGYMDVVMLAQHGVEYAVATLGTACTPEHVKKLLKLADDVVFCFDGDKAGRKAAWRALENSLEILADGKKLTFLFLPEEHDPDSYVREYGQGAFEAQVTQQAVPLAQFLLRELSAQVDMDSDEGRARLIHLAKPLLARVSAPAYALMLRKRLAEACGLALNELDGVLGGGGEARAAPAEYVAERGAEYMQDDGERQWQPSSEREYGARRSERGNWREGRGNWKEGRSDWKEGRGNWKDGRRERPLQPLPRPHAGSSDPLQRLLQLVLAAPMLAQSGEPLWQGWPAEQLVVQVLQHVRGLPAQAQSALVLEHWRDTVVFERLNAALADGERLFGRMEEAERAEEFAALLQTAGQVLARPTTLGRRAELEWRAAHGGLTEAEKQEYLALLAQRRG
ncbi:DnaB-helicase binding domain of primase [Andreprevotia lacus DSM 23236]|jgi:DNA primase|uniref:DNA primase n=1 Tax=Andreprevotia lacus DSM 23236 TaxID=1121001 RepID=A0A1W1WY75_9NEIS|nr:DNA primase [Andreprevotia lacus]SMC16615.1 DnaB-helicase binding domain of primase [Andreprevotia lacus DSM 23236]